MGTPIDPVPWKTVNGTIGISKAVTLDGVYRSINTLIIEGLKDRCDESGVLRRLNDIALQAIVSKLKGGPLRRLFLPWTRLKMTSARGS